MQVGSTIHVCNGSEIALSSGSSQFVPNWDGGNEYWYRNGIQIEDLSIGSYLAIADTGTYYAKTVTTSGCTTQSKPIRVKFEPVLALDSIWPISGLHAEGGVYYACEGTPSISLQASPGWDHFEINGPSDTVYSDTILYYGNVQDYEFRITPISRYGCKGLEDTIQWEVSNPIADFVMPDTIQKDTLYYVTNLYENPNSYRYSWLQPGAVDDTLSSGDGYLHPYADTGAFNITLIITAPGSCQDSLTKQIQVVDQVVNAVSCISPPCSTYRADPVNYEFDCDVIGNGSFPPYIQKECVIDGGQINEYCGGWQNLTPGGVHSSDFYTFEACNPYYQVPVNRLGSQADASCPNPSNMAGPSIASHFCRASYAGIATFLSYPLDEQSRPHCEYLLQSIPGTPDRSIKAGKRYAAGFKASLSEVSKYATPLGMHFTSAYPSATERYLIPPFGVLPGGSYYIHLVANPQVTSSGAITNKDGWQDVREIFTATTDYNWVTIGRFLSQSAIGSGGDILGGVPQRNSRTGAWEGVSQNQSIPVGWNSQDMAYYYIDDVFVVQLPDAGEDQTVSCGTIVTLGQINCASQLGEIEYYWTYANGTAIPSSLMPDRTVLNATYKATGNVTLKLRMAIPGYTGFYYDEVTINATSGPAYTEKFTPKTTPPSSSISLNLESPSSGATFTLKELDLSNPSVEIATIYSNAATATVSGLSNEGLYKLIRHDVSGCEGKANFYVLGSNLTTNGSLHSQRSFMGGGTDVLVVNTLYLGDGIEFGGDVKVWVAGSSAVSVPSDYPGQCKTTQSVNGYPIIITEDPYSTYPNSVSVSGSATFCGINQMWSGIYVEPWAALDFEGCLDCIVADAKTAISYGDAIIQHTSYFPTSIKHMKFRDCLNGLLINSQNSYFEIEHCDFTNTSNSTLGWPYSVARTINNTHCSNWSYVAFHSETAIENIYAPEIWLKNCAIQGYYTCIYSNEGGGHVQVDNSTLSPMHYGLLANDNASASFTLNNVVATAGFFGFASLGTSGLEWDGGILEANATNNPLPALGINSVDHHASVNAGPLDGQPFAGIRVFDNEPVHISNLNLTSTTGVYAVHLFSGGKGEAKFEGCNFSGFDRAVKLEGQQQYITQFKENIFDKNSMAINLGAGYAPPTSISPTRGGVEDPYFVLKCNEFKYNPSNSSSEIGILIESIASLPAIGTCADKSGNGWPNGPDPYNPPQTPYSPDGWISILNQSSTPLVIHRFRNEYVGSVTAQGPMTGPSLIGATASIDCGLPYPYKDWSNPPTTAIPDGCDNGLSPSYSPTSLPGGNPGITSVSNRTGSSVRLRPNPASGSVSVDFSFVGNEAIEVVNSLGFVAVLKRVGNKSAHENITLAGLPKGVYLVRVISPDKGILSEKLVVQ